MTQSLRQSLSRGVRWSLLNTVCTRLGTFLLGIVLARLLTPDEFGVFAIALTLQLVLSMFADLGLGAAIVRAEEPERLAPTVATLGVLCGSSLCAGLVLTSGRVAELVSVPEAAPVIGLMAFTFILSGIAAVPYSLLLRELRQKRLFVVGLIDTTLNASVALIFVYLGFGALSLAISRLVAQSVVTVCVYIAAGWKPKFGFDRGEAWPALRFGIPAASATMLSMALVNVDNLIIARVAGAVALGYYVIAFNVASWPMSVIGKAVKSVSFAAYSETRRRRLHTDHTVRDKSLAVGVVLAWSAAAPAGLLLALLSSPLITILYGSRWAPSAPVLSALAAFGALRVVFLIMDDYILAFGKPRSIVALQVAWLVVFVPTMIVGTRLYGIVGGAWTHAIVAITVMLPAYVAVTRAAGADVSALVKAITPPLLALIPAGVAVVVLLELIASPLIALAVCAVAGLLIYVATLGRWALSQWRALSAMSENGEAAAR